MQRPWTDLGAVTASTASVRAKRGHYWQVRAVNADVVTAADQGGWWSFTTQYRALSTCSTEPG